MSYDPFIKLTHIFSENGGHLFSPLYILPDKVTEIINGKVYLGSGSFSVSEKADQIRDLVIAKLAENKQAETMGK